MAPTQHTNPKQELSTKDAMFLLELMRDSPQPILFHIGPYCQKTGTKPNTIVKRLGEIKKRNGLNIITTTNPPNGNSHSNSNSYAAPKTASARRTKVEKKDSHDLGATAYGLPSPAESTARMLFAPAAAASVAAAAAAPMTKGANMAQIPVYMAQKKRSLDDYDEYERGSSASGAMHKKIKTES